MSGPPVPGEPRRGYDEDGRAYDLPPDRLGAGSVVDQPGQDSPGPKANLMDWGDPESVRQARQGYIEQRDKAAAQGGHHDLIRGYNEAIKGFDKTLAGLEKSGAADKTSEGPRMAVAAALGGSWTPELVNAAVAQLASTGITLNPENDPPEAVAAVIRAANITVEEMRRALAQEFGQPEIGTV